MTNRYAAINIASVDYKNGDAKVYQSLVFGEDFAALDITNAIRNLDGIEEEEFCLSPTVDTWAKEWYNARPKQSAALFVQLVGQLYDLLESSEVIRDSLID